MAAGAAAGELTAVMVGEHCTEGGAAANVLLSTEISAAIHVKYSRNHVIVSVGV